MILITTVIVLLVVFLYFRHQKLKDHWKKQSVKFVEPLPLVGNFLPTLLGRVSTAEFIQNFYNAFPNERYMGMFQFSQPILLLRDPTLIKQITIKEFDSFMNHKTMFGPDVDSLWGRNLFATTDSHWANLRKTLSPVFTSSKMKLMFTLMSDCAREMMNYLKRQDKEVVEYEMKDIFSRFTNDVIATTAFGIKCNAISEKTNDFWEMGRELTDLTGFKRFKLMLYGLPKTLLKLFNIKMVNDNVANYFRKIISETIKIREENQTIRPDLLHLLMEAKKGKLIDDENPQSSTELRKPLIDLSDEDITAQAMVFFFGGFDTTSTLLTFAIYELACNPTIQDKLREEIDETMKNNDNISYEALQGMKYLDAVVSEVLRLWPQALWLDRAANKTFVIEPERPGEKPVTINKGDICWIPVYALHRNPEYYEDPDRFDPERFSDENRSKIDPTVYLPFGIGPRSCIGNRYALLVNKLAICYLLRNFEVVPSPKTKIPVVLKKNDLSISPKDGFWFGFKKRN